VTEFNGAGPVRDRLIVEAHSTQFRKEAEAAKALIALLAALAAVATMSVPPSKEYIAMAAI
jgi:hypothetical protein